jgi:hypothetical protein
MRQSDKKDNDRLNERSLNSTGQEGHRKTKLKPVAKEKYKPKQIYQHQDEDEELDIFGYLKDDDDDDDDDDDFQ